MSNVIYPLAMWKQEKFKYKKVFSYLEGFDLWEGRFQAKVRVIEDLTCKFCGSKNVVRYGRHGDIQYWWCKDCNRKFADNAALPKMQTPVEQIAAALSMYYGGMSINGIRRHLEQQFENRPSDSTVYGWITRFSKVAIDNAKGYQPTVGDTWVADETVLKIGGKNVWFWDIIDSKTRYLLASYMSIGRTTRDAYNLMMRAAEIAGKAPKDVITDKLQAYLDGIELAFGAETKHIQAKGLTSKVNTNLIERFHGTLKDRLNVMRGLKTPETARLIMDGWLVHYNYLRPHESLAGLTPAEKAGIQFPLKNWADVVNSTASDTKAQILKINQWSDTIGSITPESYSRHTYRRKVKRRKASQAKHTESTPPMLSSPRLPRGKYK
jgi:transposase-like protein